MATDISIIGAGVIGLCAAAELAEAGHRVTVFDRQPEAAERCSTGNAGMVVPSHVIPLAAPGMVGLGLRMLLNPKGPFRIRPRLDLDQVRWMFKFWRAANQKNVDRGGPALRDLSLVSRKRFLELGQVDDFGLVQRGLLMVCRDESTLAEEAHAIQFAKRLGLSAEMLSIDELQRVDPAIRYSAAGAAYFPDDCHLNPMRFLRSVRRRLREAGGQIRYDQGMVRADTVEGDFVVLAGGVWTRELATQIGLRLPMIAGKGYSMTLTHPSIQPEVCSILVEGRVAVTPMGSTLRIGGTMEIGGEEGTIDDRRVAAIADSFCEFVPGFPRASFDGQPVWHGLRPCSPDGLPYLGRHGRYVVAAGHAMMGLSLAPGTGIVVRDLIEEREPTVSLAAFCPKRYSS